MRSLRERVLALKAITAIQVEALQGLRSGEQWLFDLHTMVH